ncbi:hypothetical protein [Blastomonas aquatica]|uniref:DUF4105 domain-containing protein n=1 Tax=Blastomonas aquatica TaxID=1510276 RepID=A0ABQ1JAV1_9SPHN|nr:hypothetical protein [Blastomonas aquatica]GGB64111.1 hypothetical protein GCM10010833_18930 [Blastomonas aquatica]
MMLKRLLLTFLIVPLLGWANVAHARVTITFYSHELGSQFPHAFATLKGKVDSTGEVVDTNVGFTATSTGPSILFGWVQGEIHVAKPKYIANSNAHFTYELTDAEYRSVMAVTDKWRNKKQKSYNLNTANCVHFIGDVATAAGLKVNPESKYFKKPTSFLKEVTALSRERLASGRVLFKG